VDLLFLEAAVLVNLALVPLHCHFIVLFIIYLFIYTHSLSIEARAPFRYSFYSTSTSGPT